MVHIDSYILEKASCREFFDGGCDIISRNGHLAALEKAGLADNLIG